jgi:hypothetical protein
VAEPVVRARRTQDTRLWNDTIDARIIEEKDGRATAEALLAEGEDAARLPGRVVLADLHDGVARSAAFPSM